MIEGNAVIERYLKDKAAREEVKADEDLMNRIRIEPNKVSYSLNTGGP